MKYLKTFKADLVQVPFNFLLYKQNYIARLQEVKKYKILLDQYTYENFFI